MINTAGKLHFGVAAVALVIAVAYAFAESGDPGGFVLLLAVVVAAVLAGLALTLSGLEDRARVYGADAKPIETVMVDASLETRPSPLPAMAALAAGLFAVGLATGRTVVTAGVIASLLVAGLWLAQDWREDPSWTPRLQARTSDRLVAPLGLPVAALVLILVIVLSVSRILLAVSKNTSVAVALVLAILLMVVFFALAARPRLGRGALAGLGGFALIALVSAGSVGAAHGARQFEQHETPGPTLDVTARNVKFSTSQLSAPGGQQVTVHFRNEDAKSVYHNISVYRPDKAPVVAGQPVHGGQKVTYHWQFASGTYTFRCDFHPTMTGTLSVQG